MASIFLCFLNKMFNSLFLLIEKVCKHFTNHNFHNFWLFTLIMGTDTEKVHKVIRIINIATSLILIALSVLSLVYVVIGAIASFKFFLVFSPFFMVLFGFMLLAAQFKIKWVLKKVGFLKSLLGRALFNIYLSSVIYYYFDSSDQALLAWVGAIALFVSGILYLLLHFGYNFKKEDSDILADDNQDGYKERLM